MASSLNMQPHGNSLSDYGRESARPLVNLVFVSPLLIIYELGILLLGPHALRNGADTWLRNLLEYLGFGQYFLLPLLTCAILLGWHHTRHDSWSLDRGVFPTMLLESFLFAVVLFGIAHVQHALWSPVTTPVVCATGGGGTAGTIGRLIGYCGAGIYEEVLFRLMMLPPFAGVLKWSGLSWRSSWIWGIVVTSLIFSAAHYELFTAGGYPFDIRSFVFRFLAGSFFATLFVLRSFGIAVGAHALYDILVEFV